MGENDEYDNDDDDDFDGDDDNVVDATDNDNMLFFFNISPQTEICCVSNNWN